MQGEEASSDEEVSKEALLEDAQAVLREIDADKEQEHGGVFQWARGRGVRRRMEFMKRAVEKQRQEARQEAEQLIQALQEEQDFDEEAPSAGDEAQPAGNAAILSALAEGGVRRQKKKGKSLEVAEHIALGAAATAAPLFAAPAVPSVFDEVDPVDPADPEAPVAPVAPEAVGGSRLLEEMSDVESEPEAEPEPVTAKVENKTEEENPWLAAATDNVSHSATRKAEEKAEEAMDVQAALSRLEKKAPAKRAREVVKGDLGFEALGQEELLGMAFEDATVEKEFEEAKQKEVEQALEQAKPVVLEGWGSWAGIVGVCGESER